MPSGQHPNAAFGQPAEGHMLPPSSLPNGQPAARRLVPAGQSNGLPAAPQTAYPGAPTPKGESPTAQPLTPRTPLISGGTPRERASRKRTAEGAVTKEPSAKVGILSPFAS